MSWIRRVTLSSLWLCAACAPDFLSAEDVIWSVPLPEVEGIQSFIVWSGDRVAATSTDWALSWHVSDPSLTAGLTVAGYRFHLNTLLLQPGDLAPDEAGRSCLLLYPSFVRSAKVDDSGFAGWLVAYPWDIQRRLAALVDDSASRCHCPRLKSETIHPAGQPHDWAQSIVGTAWVDADETVLIAHRSGWFVLDTQNQVRDLVGCDKVPSGSSNLAPLGDRQFAMQTGGSILVLRVDLEAGLCQPIVQIEPLVALDPMSRVFILGRTQPLELWFLVQDGAFREGDCRVSRYRDDALEEFDPLPCARYGPTAAQLPDGVIAMSGGASSTVRLQRPDGTFALESVAAAEGSLNWVRYHPTLGLYAETLHEQLYRRSGADTWIHMLDGRLIGDSHGRLTTVELGSGIVAARNDAAWYSEQGSTCTISRARTPALLGSDPYVRRHLGGEGRALLLTKGPSPEGVTGLAWLFAP